MNKNRKMLVGIVLLIFVAVVLLGWWGIRAMAQPGVASARQFAQVPYGGEVKFVGQIVSVTPGDMTFEVLEGRDYDQRTGVFIKAQHPQPYTILMGSEAEIEVGGIAQFKGNKNGESSIQLEELSIMTGFVKGPQ